MRTVNASAWRERPALPAGRCTTLRAAWAARGLLAALAGLTALAAPTGGPAAALPRVSQQVESAPAPSSPQPPADPVAEPLPPPGGTIERPIAGGESHLFAVELAAGDFLRVIIDQRAVDLVLHLDAGGRRLLTGDSPNGDEGPEPLAWVADAAGEHRLVVAAAKGAGRYRLVVEAVRPATEDDRRLASAERAEYRAAVATWVEKTAESRHRAVGEYEAALATWRALGEERREAAVLGYLGTLHRLLGEPERELARIEESLALWRALGDPVQAARQANNLGTAHLRAGRHAEAIAALELALDGFRAAGLAVDQGIASCNIGNLHRRAGDGAPARRRFEDGLALMRAAGARAEEAGCLISLGHLDTHEGDWERAIAGYRRALELAEATDHQAHRDAGLNNLGAVFEQQGRFHEALELYHRVLEAARVRGNRRGEAAALHNIGSIQGALGRRREAGERYLQALPIYREIGDRLAVARTLRNLARNALHDGRAGDAIEPLDEAREIADALGNRPLATEVSLDLAEQALAGGDPQAAAGHARRAAELAGETGFLPHQAAALHQLGRAARDSGDLDAAEARLGEALALWRRTGRRLSQADALHRLAGSARARGDLDLARRRLEEGLELIEEVRRTVVVEELRSSFFADRHEMFEAHVDLLMELDRRRPGEGWAERALAASEAGRARGLLDLLDRAGVDPAAGAPPELVARHAEARHNLNALERRRLELAAGGVAEAELEAVAARIAETRWQAAWLEAQILDASPRAGELLFAVPPGVAEVRRRLADVDLLLEIALGEERSFLWAVDAAGVRAFTLPGRRELEELARDAHRALSAPAAYAAGEAALAALSQRLLAPVADRLAGRRLLVVPDGALHLLPFAALPDPASPADPLVAGHDIVQLPSAAALVHLAQAPPPAAPRRALAVFADPVFEAGDGRLAAAASPADAALRSAPGLDFSRLRFSRLEAEALGGLVPPGERLVALGLDASRDAVLAADLADFRFVHFATHGVLDAEIPELSGLVLSLVDERGAPQEGFLRLHDVYRLDLAADLVTLSACRTALGREIRGEGLVGLTRGFLHAGARGVVASLWDVQDRATARLMEAFYAGMLQGGLAPEAALRAAQLELRRDARWRDPYYWAGFVLQAAPAAPPSPPAARSGDPAPVMFLEGEMR